MFKSKSLVVISITLFLILNTLYFWDKYLGPFNLLIFFIVVGTYIFLSACLLYHIIRSAIERLKDKSRLHLVALMAVILILIAWKPFGIIDYKQFEAKSLLIAEIEGAANCHSVLKLKENNHANIRHVCFGIEENEGTYRVSNDTVFLKFQADTLYSGFAVITVDTLANGKITEGFDLHIPNRKRPIQFWITQNELIKHKKAK